MTFDSAREWAEGNEALLWWIGAGSFVIMVGAALGLPFMVSMIPDDYFASPDRRPLRSRSRRPVLRLVLRIAKNVIGFFLVILGLLLSIPFVPGQGLMIAFAGLLLLEFPGKRRLEMKIIRQPRVLNAVNWLRARRGRPPLEVWHPEQ